VSQHSKVGVPGETRTPDYWLKIETLIRKRSLMRSVVPNS
jgi:hypothetical protein